MNALAAIQLVVEKATPEGWANAHGIYADLSRWPAEIEYYVKCPVCGLVHGNYKTMREAHGRKLCDTCNLASINKLKKEIVKVVDDPEHKPRAMAKIVGEALGDEFDPFDAPADEISSTPLPPEDAPADTKNEIERLLLGNWVDIALREFSHDQNYALTDIEIDEDWSERHGNYDPQNLGDTEKFKINVDGTEWLIFKDSDVAETYALEIVRSDLETQPELFAQDWLREFVNDDKLKEAIGDPYDYWEDEVRELDYEELLEKMVDEGYVENDDAMFFKLNGEPRIETSKRAAALNAHMEDYIEKEKPEIDPWEWLEDVYGKEKAGAEAIKMVGIDVDAAAKSAVNTDGWPHFVNHYDGNSHDLENGAAYCRIN